MFAVQHDESIILVFIPSFFVRMSNVFCDAQVTNGKKVVLNWLHP